MLSPAATVTVRMLEALGIVDRATARQALILWCRPSPRLAPADVRDVLATYPEPEVGQAPADLDDDGEVYHRDEPEPGEPLPPHVGEYPLGGRNRDDDGEQS